MIRTILQSISLIILCCILIAVAIIGIFISIATAPVIISLIIITLLVGTVIEIGYNMTHKKDKD
jgi:hypothetical protein